MFKDGNEGPFYLSSSERIARECNKPTGKIPERKYVKAELLQLLDDKGYLMPPGTIVNILQSNVKNWVVHWKGHQNLSFMKDG